MAKEIKTRLLYSSVLSAIAGVGLAPNSVKAQAVLSVDRAIDHNAEPLGDVTPAEAIAPTTKVKTKESAWDVPWLLAKAAAVDTETSLTASASDFSAPDSSTRELTLEPDTFSAPTPISSQLVPTFESKTTGVEIPLIAVAEDNSNEQSQAADRQAVAPLSEKPTEYQTLVSPEAPLTASAIAHAQIPAAPLVDPVSQNVSQTASQSDFQAGSQTDSQSDSRTKAPWLSEGNLIVESEETSIVSPLLALRALDEEEEKKDSPWLAFLAQSDEEKKKAPWLARTNDDDDTQDLEDPSAPRLAALPQQPVRKRPSSWISLTPEELLENDIATIAISDPTDTSGAEVYDVSGLDQVAITPADLAESNEVAISVDASEVEFLSPKAGAFLDVPATSVAIRFPVGANIALLANGKVVDASLVGRTETDSVTQLRTQTWYGISLLPGQNTLEIVSTDTGEVLQNLVLSVRGQPKRLVLLSPRSVPSDGRSTATVRGQLVDELGNVSRWDTLVTLQTSDGQFIGADQDPDLPGFQALVERGEFAAELQSSLKSHLVQLKATAYGIEGFSQIQFDTPQRPSLISGAIDLRLGAKGTDFYSSYRDFLPLDENNGAEFDVDAAVFATGNIGEWLYTGAYNSDRPLNENCQGESALFGATDSNCSNVYPTYGDDSYTDVVAPSIDSLYLKLERNSPGGNGIDYAMWGDFDTEEFSAPSQLFTATNRQLHGFKANYNFGNLALTGLYANNVEGFQRDTIAPDGTSGLYFTSQRNLVPGSESVFLEVEELERPGTVLDRQPLFRGVDYDIDYDRGTLLFNDPILRTTVDDSGLLLVRRIVTTYQYEDGSNTNIAAGRIQYDLNRKQGQESWIGATYFNENQDTRNFSLYGADAQIQIGENARIVAEIAESSSNFDSSNSVGGTAYRVEAEGDFGNWLNGRAYYRSTDAGFTNAATTSFVPGQTRYGAQLDSRLSKTTSLRARFDHEDNFGTAPRVLTDASDLLNGLNLPGRELDNSLTTYAVGLSQRIGKGTAEVDWIHRDRTDRLNGNDNLSSDQLRSRLTMPISKDLSLVAQNETNLSSNVDPIYPSRTLLGLNWEVMPGINVGANQIFYGGGGNDRGSYTSIDVTGEHTFDSDTTVRGRFSTIDGREIGGSIGLEQGIKLAPGLDLDLAYEKVFSTFGNSTAASTQFAQPFATDNGASALGLAGGETYSVGLSYTDSADFQASTRFEHRSSPRGSNTVFDLSALGRVTPSLTVLGDYRFAKAANQEITGLGATSLLKLGLAYRKPQDDRFNALLRYEHRMNPNSIPTVGSLGSSTETQEHLFSGEAIYAPNWRWELYGKYALRNSRTSIRGVGDDFSSSSTVQLAQARATYRLGYRWDAVAEARWLGSQNYSETGFALEAGYYPLPDLRVSAGYSAGANDRDFGENRSAGGFYVGVTAKLGGLLNGFGTQPNAPAQQRESALEVSDIEALEETAAPVADVEGVTSTEEQSDRSDSSEATEL